MIYHFGEFGLDDSSFTLNHGGETIHVEPRVFDLIRFLSLHPGEVLSRDRIIEEVWKGRFVSDATVSSAIKAARKALGDSGEKQQYIRTVRGRGFCFVADVEPLEEAAPGATASAQADTLPSLLIFPLDVFGDAEELQPIAEGLGENLTTVLTRIPLLHIVSRTASYALKEKYRQHGQYETDWILEGSVQKVSDHLRVNLQLIETSGGFHLWARKFEQADDQDNFDGLLDEMLATLEPQLMRAIHHRVSTGRGEPGSKQLLLQAMGILSLKGWHKDTFEESAWLLRQAITREPDLALARAWLALVLGLGHRVGLMERSKDIVQEANSEAEAALALDNMDSMVVGLAACALADIGQPARAVPLLKNAIELNDSNGHAWAALGSAQLMLKDFDAAIESLRKGINLSPADSRRAVWCAVLAIAHLFSGMPEQAVAAATEACSYDDRNYIPRVVLAGASMAGGHHQQAAQALQDSYRVKPDLSEQEIRGLLGAELTGALLSLR